MENRSLQIPRISPENELPPRRLAIVRSPSVMRQTSDFRIRLADGSFHGAMMVCGIAVIALLVLIVFELVSSSSLSLHAFGWKFFVTQSWDPVNDEFGALPFIYGTLVSSILALVIAVPLS